MGVPSDFFRSGATGCSGLMTLAVTVTRGGFAGITLVAGGVFVAGFGGSSRVLLRGSLKNRPPVRLDRGSFADGKTFSGSIDLTFLMSIKMKLGKEGNTCMPNWHCFDFEKQRSNGGGLD